MGDVAVNIPIKSTSTLRGFLIFSLLGVVACFVLSDVAASIARAQDLVDPLDAASRDYRDGNYRAAMAKLASLSGAVAQLSLTHQLNYWNLQADVAAASNLPVQADQASRKHIALLKQDAALPLYERRNAERRALVRLARITRTLAGEQAADDGGRDVDAQLLQDACKLYSQALKLYDPAEEDDALWEADTRFALARSLELLNDVARAKTEFAAAAEKAEAAVAKLAAEDTTIEQFLRGATIVRRAYVSDQSADKHRQARKALKLYQGRLENGSKALAARVRILKSSAACYQQADEKERERHVLARILDAVRKMNPAEVDELDPLLVADVMIRLAELTEAPQTKQALYRESANRYFKQLDRIKQMAAAQVNASSATGAAPSPRPSPATADPRLEGRGSEKLTEDERIGKQLECLLQLQIVNVRLGDWGKAIQAANELLKLRRQVLAEKDPSIYRTVSVLGSLHAKRARATRMQTVGDDLDLSAVRADVDNAKRHLQDSLEFWRKQRPQSPKDLFSTLNYYAEVLRYDGDFRGAEAKLIEIERSFDPKTIYSENHVHLAEFYTNQAAVQSALGQYNSAKENYDRAAEIAGGGVAAGAEQEERRRLLAMIYLNEAQLYKSQRQFGEARTKCDLAVQAAREGSMSGQDLAPFELAQASLLIAEADQDALPKATSSSDVESNSPEQIQNIVRKKLEKAVRIASGISGTVLYDMMAEHLEALARYRLYENCGGDVTHLEEARRIWNRIVEKRADKSPQTVTLTARACNHLVAIALREAAASRQKLFKLSSEEKPDETKIAELSNLYQAQLQQAEELSKAGEQAAEQMVAYPAVHVQALMSRALVLSALADIHRKKAASLEDDAEADREQQWAGDKTDEAIAKLREAVQLIEMPRAMTVGAEAERALYFAQFAPVFDLLVELLTTNERYEEAIEAADLRRSRTFQDQLRACGVDLAETADPQRAKAAKQAAENFYALANRLKEKWADPDQRTKLSVELETLRGEFVRAEQGMKSTSVAARQLLRESGDAKAIAAELRAGKDNWSKDEVALIYYIGSGKSYLFACGGKFGVDGQELTVTAEQAELRGLKALSRDDKSGGFHLGARHVAQLVRDVRVGVEKLPDDAGRDRASRGSNALTLSYAPKVVAETDYAVTDILLPPEVRQKILDAPPKHLIVIPDGALHQLSLELLPIKPDTAAAAEEKTYVLDKFPPISYAPSLLIERKLRAGERMSDHQIALLSLADPSYSEPTTVRANGDEASSVSGAGTGNEFRQLWGGGFARLDGFKKESIAVCEAFENATSSRGRIETLRDKDATERQFKAKVRAHPGQIGFLHVAAHGVVSQEYNNLFGALALTPPDQTSQDDDGYLSLHEVFDLRLKNCEMVVLSACDTNRGPGSPLEAGSTMARAFICSGARRVVCSHWGADDNATTALISDFMRQVSTQRSGDGPVDFATALHEAKRRLRKDSPSPYFWAPFVLIGPPTSEGNANRQRAVAAQ